MADSTTRDPIATIGLESAVVQHVRARLDRPVVSYATPPRLEVRTGRTLVESARIAGRMLAMAGVVWHGYFDEVAEVRRALALSSTPTFPDIRATLPHDDRFLSLAMATRVDGVEVGRSLARRGEELTVPRRSVAKWGHRHCGDGKSLFEGRFTAEELTLVEPFVEGSSERILLVGDAVWQLRYESADWRKNVNARVSVVSPPDGVLVARARKLANALALPMVGVDFIVHANGATLLELNTYPGLDDAPGANEAFADAILRWAENLP